MGGTTAGGWPYVTPDDHPLQFPAHSQALANKLQATPAIGSGWLLRSTTNSSVASGTDASICGVTATGATGRRVMITGMALWQSTAVSNVTVFLKSATTTLAGYTINAQPANLPQALPIAWAGVLAPADDLYLLFNGSAGTHTAFAGSYLAVIVP